MFSNGRFRGDNRKTVSKMPCTSALWCHLAIINKKHIWRRSPSLAGKVLISLLWIHFAGQDLWDDQWSICLVRNTTNITADKVTSLAVFSVDSDFFRGLHPPCFLSQVKEVLPSFTEYMRWTEKNGSNGLTNMPIRYHVEGSINAVYSELLLSTICADS